MNKDELIKRRNEFLQNRSDTNRKRLIVEFLMFLTDLGHEKLAVELVDMYPDNYDLADLALDFVHQSWLIEEKYRSVGLELFKTQWKAAAHQGGLKIRCTVCGTVIQSMHRHDFVSCQCKQLGLGEGIFVDGGTDYTRIGGTTYEVMK